MKPVLPGDRRITNIHEAEFVPFVYPDGVALGDRVLQLDTSRALGEGFHVYRMPPGMRTRGHRHNGHEQFVILEGELHESDGTVLTRAISSSIATGRNTIPTRRTAAFWRFTSRRRKPRSCDGRGRVNPPQMSSVFSVSHREKCAA
ncbi:MAG: hypothetical protein ACKVPY_13565 [Paracoccaceae bacterium]